MKRVIPLWVRWTALLGVVALCYWPGLHGGFVFDDDVNILQKESLRINALSRADLWAAAWSGNAGPLGRPVAMLTFALNYYFAGPDAFYFKAVNLFIHLINTLLVGALAQRICGAISSQHHLRGFVRGDVGAWAGWIVATLWALHPLNLTGVLYVVQRMTCLSTFFGLAALLIYVRFRERTCLRNEFGRPIWSAFCHASLVLFCLVMSAFSKETGLLFAPLLVWIEIWGFGFRLDGKAARLLGWDLRRAIYVLLTAGGCYVAVFIVPGMVGASAYVNRDFTLTERSLTESRALFFYLQMFVLPTNSYLSLYHDDFEISRSLLQPASTAFSLIGLAVISVAAWRLRRRLPELAFGWGWFLISHSLESTIFPLELVHEHRNYFATIGLLLMIPLALMRMAKLPVRRVLAMLLATYMGLLGFVTHVRALQWSNNVDWAALEAANHPRSARATYELARVYMILRSRTGDERFGALADDALAQAIEAYEPGILPFMAKIQLAYFRGLEPDPMLFDVVEQRLRNGPYYATNTALLQFMMTCQVDQTCKMQDAQALKLFSNALANPRIPTRERSEVLKLQAQYAINRMNDLAAGVVLIRQSIDVLDAAPSRVMYAQGLAMQGKYAEALAQLDRADDLDSSGIYRQRIGRERENIQGTLKN